MAFVNYTLHVPSEWIMINDYNSLIISIINEMEDFAHIHSSYQGFITIKNNVGSFLIIDDVLKIYWFKIINIEGDSRPENVNYYPPLAPVETEMNYPESKNWCGFCPHICIQNYPRFLLN
ncbi:hypothetical protein PV328_001179 [Microctonus aethiopoides]|uniref:Uncharacterized protein n=1 Tax=Microctonus aethiopoides TaxID=144406 RepID=A0AA39KX83_9HYME|nr:hypothetical protein PV328_001179 [Microctonus aethiopoides]